MTAASTGSQPGPWVAVPLAALAWVVTVGMVGAGLVLGGGQPNWLDAWLIPVQATAFATVGGLIAARRPRNAVGWLFCVVGLFAAGYLFALSYQQRALVTAPGTLPLGVELAWAQAWLYVPALGTFLTLLPLLFPTGRPPSRRWWPVLWLDVVALVAVTLADALRPGVIGQSTIVNPLGIDPAAHDLLQIVAMPGLFVPATLLSVWALITRWRRADDNERVRLKWFAAAAALLPLMPVMFVVSEVGRLDGPVYRTVEAVLVTVVFLALPSATGIAILRHRLFDIDRIVSRTVTYAAVTGLLVAVYAVSVVALGAVLEPVAGTSDPAVAGSTLAVAALFGPVRRRVQAVVDRRFNRRRYDAGRAVERFGQRLRGQVDLGEITGDLRRTVGTTLQPASVSLWIRGPGH